MHIKKSKQRTYINFRFWASRETDRNRYIRFKSSRLLVKSRTIDIGDVHSAQHIHEATGKYGLNANFHVRFHSARLGQIICNVGARLSSFHILWSAHFRYFSVSA